MLGRCLPGVIRGDTVGIYEAYRGVGGGLRLCIGNPEDIGLHEFGLYSLISVLERTERTGGACEN